MNAELTEKYQINCYGSCEMQNPAESAVGSGPVNGVLHSRGKMDLSFSDR